MTAQVVGHRLERDGAEVHTAEDGLAALHLLEIVDFDATLLDAELDGVDGLEILSRIRAGELGRHDLPVLILTWPGNDGLATRAYGMNADIVLARPISLSTISAAVRRLARRPRSVKTG